ncbi:MAG: hypothetical protein NTW16_19920 [Bacteroidetes bacterium]|nr:hypothetical protein [Bacteroidota bacterium]
MGYYLASSSRNLAYFLKRGIMLFIGGVLLNMARSANLLIQIMRGQVDLDPWFYILGADILTLAGLSLMLTGVLRVIFRERLLLFFLTILVIVVITPYLNQIRASGFSTRF